MVEGLTGWVEKMPTRRCAVALAIEENREDPGEALRVFECVHGYRFMLVPGMGTAMLKDGGFARNAAEAARFAGYVRERKAMESASPARREWLETASMLRWLADNVERLECGQVRAIAEGVRRIVPQLEEAGVEGARQTV